MCESLALGHWYVIIDEVFSTSPASIKGKDSELTEQSDDLLDTNNDKLQDTQVQG